MLRLNVFFEGTSVSWVHPNMKMITWLTWIFFLTVDDEKRKKHKAAYRKILREKATINILPVRFNYVGLPRSGKTSFIRRLLGEMLNIMEAKKSGVKVQPSTGVVEEAGQVIIRTMETSVGTIQGKQGKEWSLLKNLPEEANMLSQFFYQIASMGINEDSEYEEPTQTSSSTSCVVARDDDSGIDEILSVFREAMESNQWDSLKYILEDIILLINTDTGGQAEFLDLHASLVQGPSFNLLFSRLIDELESEFKVYYTNEEGVSTEAEDSTMTVKEVLFQALSSIACFGGCFSGGISAPSEESQKLAISESKAMFVGTYRDKITKSEFKEKDHLLQQAIKCTKKM